MAVCSASGWRSPLRRAAPRACPLLPYRDKVLHLVEGRRGQDSTSRRQAQEAFRILLRSGLATTASSHRGLTSRRRHCTILRSTISFPGNGNIMNLGDIRNLDYTILLCSHMQETREFYHDVMGFSLVHDSERWVSFQVGSALLTLRPRGPGLAWDDGPIAPGSAAVQLAFRVPPHRLDACHEMLQSKGVAILSPPPGYCELAASRALLPRPRRKCRRTLRRDVSRLLG